MENYTINILLIEDDPDDQLTFCEALKKICAVPNCSIAHNGEEAINMLSRNDTEFDIIFCDLNMPVMNGYSFLKSVSTSGICSKVPVIILSTSSNASEAECCREMGATMFLTKPLTLSAFGFKLGQALKSYISHPEKKLLLI